MEKRIELYVNSTKPQAAALAKRVKKELENANYEIVSSNPDIVIGFGGDGTFLNWLREKKTVTSVKYIGVNCGTLGFLQDFTIKDIKLFVANIPRYKQEHLNTVKLVVETEKGGKMLFEALNEFYVVSANEKALKVKISVNGDYLEDYVGTGLIFSTPTGSTAHNLSAGGAVIYPGCDIIQITPSEAIVNKKIHSLSRSICMPSKNVISIIHSIDEEIKIVADGAKVFSGKCGYIGISGGRVITKLTDPNVTFTERIREKLI